MNKHRLAAKIRSIGVAYLLFIFIGAHYAYVNKWGTQILFWITFGGLGIWWLIDIFRIPGMVHRFNDPIFDELDYIERKEYIRDDFAELHRMKAERSGNLLEEQWLRERY